MKNKKYCFKRNNGFTLMELLVTIGIIGILSSISLFAITGSRKSARDARRKADLESIRSALELYRADCGVYPATLPAIGNPIVSAVTTPTTCPTAGIRYLEKVPSDPALSTGIYSYNPSSGNTRYALCAHLEETPVPAMTTTACTVSCSGGSCNYIVNNP